MFKLALCFIVSMNILSCFTMEDTKLNANNTGPTWSPFPKATGLFKFVQSCENFCDEQFPPGALEAEPLKAVLGCRKGCYSFEIFKGMSSKSTTFATLNKICSASCGKEWNGEEFPYKFCSLGCARMTSLYRELRLELDCIEKHHNHEKGKELDKEKLKLEAEKNVKEQQEKVAKELALAVLLGRQKEGAINSGQPRRGFKRKIFHLERFVGSAEYRPYVDIQRIDVEPYEDVPSGKRLEILTDTDNRAEDGNIEEDMVMEWPLFQKQLEREWPPLFLIPIYIMTLIVFAVVVFGLGRKFREALLRYDTVETGDEEEINDKFLQDLDYITPPPEKDAPPPYVEISVEDSDRSKRQ